MNISEIIKKFEIKKETNKKNMDNLSEKIKMSLINQLDLKMGILLAFSSIFFLISSFTFLFASSAGLVINSLSVGSVAALLIGAPLAMGAIINKIVNKKFQIKERIKKFSKAKTEQEKLEEEIRYQIEYEKLNIKNNIIGKTIADLEKNSKILNEVSNNYYLINKDESKSKEDLENDINNISDKIKELESELDELITRKILCDVLSGIKTWPFFVIFIMLVFTTCSMYTGLVLYLAAKITNTVITGLFLLPNGLISLFASFINGYIMNKKNSNLKAIFNKINSELGNITLTDELSNSPEKLYNEIEKIKSLIKLKTDEISAFQVLLLEKKQALEILSSTEEVKKDKQNSQNLNLQHSFIQEESTVTLEEEGPKLVKTIKPLR